MPNIVVAYIKEDKVAPYLEALAAVGVPESDIFRATPRRTATIDLEAVLERADGLLLTDGADIQPCLYGEARLRAANLDKPVPDRDQLEWDLLVEARAQRMPVFGICRGHQMINVFLGGTLFQDIELQTRRQGHDNFIDRTIEATVAPDPAWWIASVQWHPENLIEQPFHRGLFEDFLAAAAAFAERRTRRISAGVLR